MYRVTRTVRVAKNPSRFTVYAQEFETQTEAETIYIRACIEASTARVCLDVFDGRRERWRPLACFAVR